ncbi:hypothetical protein PDE_03867 [Penicillium oxalicum 114-2]|uniref:Uncharacterized protein n=1 Tax=Penicillium oxalicum (strain 114-2 / CGMCC 5302) TaxID=933388 RepID=S7ZJS6_PENO1|nr:hypothetical protein PDE_03867 [Penicillium oxalicum 114-2]
MVSWNHRKTTNTIHSLDFSETEDLNRIISAITFRKYWTGIFNPINIWGLDRFEHSIMMIENQVLLRSLQGRWSYAGRFNPSTQLPGTILKHDSQILPSIQASSAIHNAHASQYIIQVDRREQESPRHVSSAHGIFRSLFIGLALGRGCFMAFLL